MSGNELLIRTLDDLAALPNATERAAHVGDDSDGPPEVTAAVRRLLATWNRSETQGVRAEPAERLPVVFEEVMTLLDQNGLVLFAEVMEPGVHRITNTIGWLQH